MHSPVVALSLSIHGTIKKATILLVFFCLILFGNYNMIVTHLSWTLDPPASVLYPHADVKTSTRWRRRLKNNKYNNKYARRCMLRRWCSGVITAPFYRQLSAQASSSTFRRTKRMVFANRDSAYWGPRCEATTVRKDHELVLNFQLWYLSILTVITRPSNSAPFSVAMAVAASSSDPYLTVP